MKVKYIFPFFLLSLICFSYSLTAQSVGRQTIASNGGSALIDRILISQTVGQPYNTSSGISYRPGFQQPYNKKGAKTSRHQLLLQLFPNPIVSVLTIKSPIAISNAVVRVVDLSGLVIYTDKVTNLTTYKIDCQQWAPGTYVFTASDGFSGFYSSQIIVVH